MVCEKCEKKLAKVACSTKDGENSKSESGGRKINENKMLSKKARWTPYSSKCSVCKGSVAKDYQFCQKCAYHNGNCAMCGIKILDTKGYKQSAK